MANTVLEIPKISIEEVSKYVRNLITHNLPQHIYFHRWEHTLAVKNAAEELAKKEQVEEESLEVLSLAALFHDTGFINDYQNHERESQKIAAQYLHSVNYPVEKIERVKALIASTAMDKIPVTQLEKILCDADLAHLGKKKYKTTAQKIRMEQEQQLNLKYSDLDWEKSNFVFIRSHQYYTEAAKKSFNNRKAKNIQKARKRIRKLTKKQQEKIADRSIGKNKAAQVMFKTALRNHIDLTNIADQKSNIMLSINALLLTIGMPVFASYLSDKTYLLVPSIFFMITCISTMVFATLSTRPIKMDGETNLKKINNGKTNLFFFGNFYKIKLDNYQKAMKKVIANQEQLDNTFINDLYFLGHALGDKFRYLRTCYNVFIVGIILTFIAFVISYVIYVPEIQQVVEEVVN